MKMLEQISENEKEIQAQVLAGKMMESVRIEVAAYMPYLDRAMLNMPIHFFTPNGRTSEAAVFFGTDGEQFYALASIVMQLFEQGEEQMIRIYLHSIMHCLFAHMYGYASLETQVWDLASDMAVENIILSFHWQRCEIEGDDVRRRVLLQLKEKCGKLNADTIYAYLLNNEDEKKEYLLYGWMFRQDRHDIWGDHDIKKTEGHRGSQEQEEKWKQIEKNVERAAEKYEKVRGLEPGTITRHFSYQARKAEDYDSLLRRFMKSHEAMKLDMDSFDYVYYTYGLELYHNMPLIEPLEYQVNARIQEFVIAVDTSGSCEGERIKKFIAKTYDILHSNCFADQMELCILQCDAAVQEEVWIHDIQELEGYLQDFTIKGMGGTDFRPVFERVNALKEEGRFKDLAGVLYFTDGHGEYPKRGPDYPVMFVMIDDQEELPKVPSWAVRAVIEEKGLNA